MATTAGRVRNLFKLQRYIIALLFISFICGMVLGITLVTSPDLTGGIFGQPSSAKHNERKDHQYPGNAKLSDRKAVSDLKFYKEKLPKTNKKHQKGYGGESITPIDAVHANPKNEGAKKDMNLIKHETEEIDNFPSPNYNLHIFYYPWYANPEFDENYYHWNHPYLSHWDKNEDKKWPHGRHHPPDDIGSNYYPELGPYSSKNPEVMENHMKQLRSAGVGKNEAINPFMPTFTCTLGAPNFN